MVFLYEIVLYLTFKIFHFWKILAWRSWHPNSLNSLARVRFGPLRALQSAMTKPSLRLAGRSVSTTLAAFAFVCLSISSVFAQSETGSITGTVTDPSGAAVANAKVTVTNAATTAVRNTTSGTSGVYSVTNLQPAPYLVKVEAPGFKTSQIPVTVTVGTREGLDVKLQVGDTSTVIEVAESAVTVNTESQTLSQAINSKQIVELPTLSRSPYALVATVGNVSGNTPDGRGAGVAINGQRASSTNIMLDGTANNDEFGAGIGQNVPLDSVQEFTVLTNNFTAEFGRASGGIGWLGHLNGYEKEGPIWFRNIRLKELP